MNNVQVYVGAYAELVVKPLPVHSVRRRCSSCSSPAYIEEAKFCLSCGYPIIEEDIITPKIPYWSDLLEPEVYPTHMDAFLQVPDYRKSETLLLMSYRHTPENVDSFFRIEEAEITPEIVQEYLKAFQENYQDVLGYLQRRVEDGLITSLQVKFGFITYYM